MPSQPPSEQDVFDAARQLQPGEEREVYLRDACGGDSAFEQRIRALLAAFEKNGSFLETPVLEPPLTILTSSQEVSPTIGPYKLLEQIGEGGMGAVYLAEQREPVKRTVALKLIKPGMDSRQIIARFEAERQALAMMDHPHIAIVLDGGTTEQGQPYFVMELVKGVPITQYCDEKHLTLKERLELFVPVCQAVQHAHQKGIIHRDLKPSNVLVTEYDERPVGKIIDFGVAKAIGAQLTDKTIFTALGQLVGTLEYMSPEQAKLNQLDIDTRSDIYSLGILLYELLTGSTPFDRHTLESAAFDEILRIIREQEPPRPSFKLSSSDTLPSVAASRNIEPARLSRQVRGELDWIVMKCLEKERNRRYETANSLAHDIERYLSDEPVQACPPSLGYRLRKAAWKNRKTLAALAAIAITLIVGTAVSVWQAIRATQAERDVTLALHETKEERDRATRAESQLQAALVVTEKERDRAVKAEELAEANLRQARDAVDHLLTRAARHQLRNLPKAAEIRRSLLEDALKFYEGFVLQKESDPELLHEQAQLFQRIGQLRQELTLGEEACAAHRQALEICERLVAEHPGEIKYQESLVNSLDWLSECLHHSVWELSESAACRDRAIKELTTLMSLDPDEPKYAKRLMTFHARSTILAEELGRIEDSERHRRQMMELYNQLTESSSPPDNLSWAIVRSSRANALAAAGRNGEAEQEFRSLIRDADKTVEATFQHQDRFQQGQFRISLIELLRKQGRAAEAVALNGEAIGILRELVADFPTHGTYRWHFHSCLMNHSKWIHRERPADAEAALAEVETSIQQIPEDRLNRYVQVGNLCTAYLKIGLPDRAESIARSSLALAEKQLPHDSRKFADMKRTMASVLFERGGQDAEAEGLARRAVEIFRQRPSEHGNALPWTLLLHARILTKLNRNDEAIEAYLEAGMLFHESRVGSGGVGQCVGWVEFLMPRLGALREEISADPRWPILTAEYLKQHPNSGKNWVERLKIPIPPDQPDGFAKEISKVQGPIIDHDYVNREIWKIVLSDQTNATQADRCVALMKKAIEANPDSALYFKTLGMAYYRAGRWDEAATAYAKLLKTLPKQPQWNSPRALACQELAQWDEVFTRLVQRDPGDSDLWIGRGRCLAQQRRWREAKATYEKVINTRPVEIECVEYASLLILTDDEDGYRRYCRDLFDRVRKTGGDREKFIATRACALSPQSSVPKDTLVAWGKAVVKSKTANFHLHALSLAYLRDGQPRLAFEESERSLKTSPSVGAQALSYLVMAMAHHELAREKEARDCLKEANKRFKTTRGFSAPDFVTGEVLQREAVSRIGLPAEDTGTNDSEQETVK